MSAPHLQHLAALIDDDGHAASFQSLGQYRAALLKEIAEASAAPEQDHDDIKRLHDVMAAVPCASLYSIAEAILEAGYIHAAPSEVEQLRAENKELTLKLAQSDHNYDCDRDLFREKLEAVTQRADTAERKLASLFECTGCGVVSRDPHKWLAIARRAGAVSCCPERNIVNLLSASAEPDAQDVSGLEEALEQIVRQYPNQELSHVDYRVHACRQAEHALAAHRAQQGEQP